MLDYGMSEYSRFVEGLKGCSYSTDVPGAVKCVLLKPVEHGAGHRQSGHISTPRLSPDGVCSPESSVLPDRNQKIQIHRAP